MWRHLSPDDAKTVEVAAPALGAKRLLERDRHIGDVVAVPDGSEDAISKSKTYDTPVF